jgi:hypothetical protein
MSHFQDYEHQTSIQPLFQDLRALCFHTPCFPSFYYKLHASAFYFSKKDFVLSYAVLNVKILRTSYVDADAKRFISKHISWGRNDQNNFARPGTVQVSPSKTNHHHFHDHQSFTVQGQTTTNSMRQAFLTPKSSS